MWKFWPVLPAATSRGATSKDFKLSKSSSDVRSTNHHIPATGPQTITFLNSRPKWTKSPLTRHCERRGLAIVVSIYPQFGQVIHGHLVSLARFHFKTVESEIPLKAKHIHKDFKGQCCSLKALKLTADLALFHCVPSSHITLLLKLDYKKIRTQLSTTIIPLSVSILLFGISFFLGSLSWHNSFMPNHCVEFPPNYILNCKEIRIKYAISRWKFQSSMNFAALCKC